MKKLVVLLCLITSMNAYAVKYRGLTEQQSTEIDLASAQIMTNITDRTPYYTQAYDLLNTARLLPNWSLNYSRDRLPQPVYQRNIIHFFWYTGLIYAEMLTGGLYGYTHCFLCPCGDYNHPTNAFNNNPTTDYFRGDVALAQVVLGTTEQLRGILPPDKAQKIPTHAEVLYLDFLGAKYWAVARKCEQMRVNYPGMMSNMTDIAYGWPANCGEFMHAMGKSIAYKVSKSENFTKFAFVPFFNHIQESLNYTGDDSENKRYRARADLMIEIILSMMIDHHGDDPVALLEAGPSPQEINELIERYDHFQLITKLRAVDHIFLGSIGNHFLHQLINERGAHVTTEIRELEQALNIGIFGRVF